jgi:hypothetical protein
LAWKYPDKNIGVEIFRPKFGRENIPTKKLTLKYSDQNFGVKVFRPKFWSESIQTKVLAK